MINIYIECGTDAEMHRIRELFHNALAGGSPAYNNSEISIVTEHDTGFNLIIGWNNDNDLGVTVGNYELT